MSCRQTCPPERGCAEHGCDSCTRRRRQACCAVWGQAADYALCLFPFAHAFADRDADPLWLHCSETWCLLGSTFLDIGCVAGL